jgi:hypothetical protein
MNAMVTGTHQDELLKVDIRKAWNSELTSRFPHRVLQIYQGGNDPLEVHRAYDASGVNSNYTRFIARRRRSKSRATHRTTLTSVKHGL